MEGENLSDDAPPVEEPPIRPLWRRIMHWGPLIAITIIGSITSVSIYCHLQWWPPERSLGGLFDMAVFLIWNYLTLTNLFSAAYVGPGYVPLRWKSPNEEDEQKLQFCEYCKGFKVPRSHHCRQCKRCVMKMDHHCPWINNCVGHKNQGYFVAFLISAVIGCTHACFILGPSIYRAIFRVWYLYYGTGKEPIVELGLYGMLGAVFAFGLAFGVIVAVGFLFVVQMRIIWRNRTGIEDYIITKAKQRPRETPFVYPYDLGWKRNLKQVITWNLEPACDGIDWPIKEGCDRFDFTIEQIELKRLKRQIAVECEIVEPYDGGRCVSRDLGGCKAFCTQPMLTGEYRLTAKVGDRVLVTRFRRHWLYGEVLKKDESPDSTVQRGWFPRLCAVHAEEEENVDQGNKENGETCENAAAGDIREIDPNGISVDHQKVE